MAPLSLTSILRREIPVTIHYATTRGHERPWVVFIHHFGGNNTSNQRHVNALTAAGFDCVTFSFSWHGERPSYTLPYRLMERWSRELQQVLRQLDETRGPREKILFAFSGFGTCALDVLAQRLERGERDIVALICDSGPFIDPAECTDPMIRTVYGYENPLWRKITLQVMMMMWGPHHNERILTNVDRIARRSPEFPILSIRGMTDPLVPPQKIAPVFENPLLKNLRVLELPTGHLTGLRDCPKDYKTAVFDFLKPWASSSATMEDATGDKGAKHA